jgi:dTDP-4-dehydrorhamnose reductase
MSNVHVFGAKGLLGHEVVAAFRAAGYRVTGTTHAQCDVANYVRVREVLQATPKPITVINAAAFTDVDGAEDSQRAAFESNTIGPHNLALVCRELDSTLVHISTDYIFDGTKPGPYDEFDAPRPLSVYGHSKWQGEEMIRRTWPKAIIIRTSSLYGRSGANFASALLARARAGERLRVDGERRTTPTSARAVAEQIRVLLSTPFYGTYHAVCHGVVTFSQYAQEILRLAGLPNPIDPVPTSNLDLKAKRPREAVLANHLLGLRGLDRMPDWRVELSRYVAEEVLP